MLFVQQTHEDEHLSDSGHSSSEDAADYARQYVQNKHKSAPDHKHRHHHKKSVKKNAHRDRSTPNIDTPGFPHSNQMITRGGTDPGLGGHGIVFNSAKSDVLVDWRVGDTIGRGSFGWVKIGFNVRTSSTAALKFIPIIDTRNRNNFKLIANEIAALKSIKHPNIINLLSYHQNCEYVTKPNEFGPQSHTMNVSVLVMEYASKGGLFDFLKYTDYFEEPVVKYYFKQLISGIEECHSRGIIHRDLKPCNLLLDQSFNLKIADFGLCKVFELDERDIFSSDDEKNQYNNPNNVNNNIQLMVRSGRVGTLSYMAPEIIAKKPYDTTCDIYSTGIILFHLLNGYLPFEEASANSEMFQLAVHHKYKQFWELNNCQITYNESAKDLFLKLIEYDPKRRISIVDIKQHPWYKPNAFTEELTPSELFMKVSDKHALMLSKQSKVKQKKQHKQPIQIPESKAPKDVAVLAAVPQRVNNNLNNHLNDELEQKINLQPVFVPPKFAYMSSLEVPNSLDDIDEYYIKNALVAIIGIGDYPINDPKSPGPLVGIEQDYKNMIKLFVNYYGYSAIYQSDKNDIEYLTKSKLIQNNRMYNHKFKIKWNEYDLDYFVTQVKQKVKQTRPDALIFIISSHGNRGRLLLDSDCATYSLEKIYHHFYNTKSGCPYLADKPKLFFIDACQGNRRPIPQGVVSKKKKKRQPSLKFRGGGPPNMARLTSEEVMNHANVARLSFSNQKQVKKDDFIHALIQISTVYEPAQTETIFGTLKSVTKKLRSKDFKYRTLDTTNPRVVDRLLGFVGVVEFLFLLGFESSAHGTKLLCKNPKTNVVTMATDAICERLDVLRYDHDKQLAAVIEESKKASQVPNVPAPVAAAAAVAIAIGKDNQGKKKDKKNKQNKQIKQIKHVDPEANIEVHLDYENFCYVYGNLDGYAVVDGGKNGGYLINAIKNVLLQKGVEKNELGQIVKDISNEATRLVKGGLKKADPTYQENNNMARQIVECTNNIQNEVFFKLDNFFAC